MKLNPLDALLRHKTLTRAQEVALFGEYGELRKLHGERDARTQRVKHRIVLSYMKLVAKLALKFRGLTFEDRVHEGALGLMVAVERFEVERGYRLGTCAKPWIVHHIRKAVMDCGRDVRLPANVHRAKFRGVYEHDGVELTAFGRSMDAVVAGHGSADVDVTMHDVLASDVEPADDRMHRRRSKDDAWGLVTSGKLDAKEQDIVMRRFGLGTDEPQTLKEIGDSYGVSRERIRQLEAASLETLRDAVRARNRRSRVAAG